MRRVSLFIAVFSIASLVVAETASAQWVRRSSRSADRPAFDGEPEGRGCFWYRQREYCGRYCYVEANGQRYCRERERRAYPQAPEPQSPAADVLLALSKFDPEVKELVEASAKYPLSRFAIHYEDNFSCLLPHLARFKGLAMLLQLRAVAHLENGQPEAAFEETKLSFRLSDSIQSENYLWIWAKP